MRLTIDLLRQAPQITNAVSQRELDLRGLRVTSLDEHALVLLGDTFDCINLTSNALSSLEYFPLTNTPTGKSAVMQKVVTLIVHNNQLQKVSVASCVRALPNVRHFLADRNNFKTVHDLLFLKQWPALEIVSFERNPLFSTNPDGLTNDKIRAFLVYLCPNLKLINYERVREVDRRLAATMSDEFAKLAQSQSDTDVSSSGTGAKKIRKRGRENRGKTTADTATDPNGGEGEAHITDEMRDQRFAELQERLGEDLTEEEVAQISREIEQLTMEASRSKRRRI